MPACLPACLQVKLVSARGLFLDSVLERLHGLQARLLLPNRRPVLSGVVQLGRSREQEVVWEHEEQFTEVRAAVTCPSAACCLDWQPPSANRSQTRFPLESSLEEGEVPSSTQTLSAARAVSLLGLQPQVIALSDLIIEVWGLPSGRMFAQGAYRANAAAASRGGPKHDGSGGNSRHPTEGAPAGGADGSGGHGELPSNSVFLGAVTVSTLLSRVLCGVSLLLSVWWHRLQQACMPLHGAAALVV